MPPSGGRRLSSHLDRPGRRYVEIGNESEKRRFTASAGTDERDKLVIPHGEGHVPDRGEGPGVKLVDLADVRDRYRERAGGDGRGYGSFAAASRMAVVMTSAAVIGLSSWFKLFSMSMLDCHVAWSIA